MAPDLQPRGQGKKKLGLCGKVSNRTHVQKTVCKYNPDLVPQLEACQDDKTRHLVCKADMYCKQAQGVWTAHHWACTL